MFSNKLDSNAIPSFVLLLGFCQPGIQSFFLNANERFVNQTSYRSLLEFYKLLVLVPYKPSPI